MYTKSASYHTTNECVIIVNGGDNLCENKRGHNIVVIDPETDEYESVHFDTYKSQHNVCFCLLVFRLACMTKCLHKNYMSSKVFYIE